MAAPAFRSEAHNSTASTSTASLTVNVPAGVVNGDILLLVVVHRGSEVADTPAGWTAVPNTPQASGTGTGAVETAVFTRVASSEPASYNATLASTGTNWSATILAYSGGDTTTPVDVSAGAIETVDTVNGVAPSVTTTVADTRLVCVWGGDTNQNATPPGSMVERVDSNGFATTPGRAVMIADEAIAATGATGTRTATVGSTADWAMVTLALRPAAGAGAQNITGAGNIATAEAFGTATLLRGAVILSPSAIASAEVFGTAKLNLTIKSAGAIASGELFGTPAVISGGGLILPGGIASAEAFGTATLLRGPVSIQPTGIASLETFGTPKLNLLIRALGISSAEAVGSPIVLPGGVVLIPVGIASAQAFGTPIVDAGSPPAFYVVTTVEEAWQILCSVTEADESITGVGP